MKKLKPTTKRIHPSPPSSPFSLLPSALLAVAASLSLHDQETLAYLLDCQKPNLDSNHHQRQSLRRQIRQINHQPQLGCACFGCYKSYWARWDASPNRHVIDTIIDAFEESLGSSLDPVELKGKGPGRRRRSGKVKKDEILVAAEEVSNREVSAKIEEDEEDGGDDEEEEEEEEEVGDGEGKSSVRRFVSWVFGMNG